MNFQSMEYFAAVAKNRSFTRAADALHITQQTLSAHIAGIAVSYTHLTLPTTERV